MIILFSYSLSIAEENHNKTSDFDESWLKAVVSIEITSEPGVETSVGTGFIVQSPNHHLLLITAKHVVLNKKGNIRNNLAIRINDKSGQSILYKSIDIENSNLGNWFLSKTSDLACKFILRKETSDILSIPLSMFLPTSELNVGAPLMVLGFPMGLRSDEFAVPIVRKAMAAKVDPDIVIIDGLSFPGNSGGPVVYKPAIKFGKGINSAVINEQRLIGLVYESINYVDTAISQQTKRARITFEENSGLSNVIPADEILKLIKRKDVLETDKKIQ